MKTGKAKSAAKTTAFGAIAIAFAFAQSAYAALVGKLRTAMKPLARRIEPKVYEYGFLKG